MTTKYVYRKRNKSKTQRKGVITVFAALLSVVVLGMVAFAVDISYVLSCKEELQRSADSAALAAVWEYAEQLSQGHSGTEATNAGRAAVATYAGENHVAKSSLEVDLNESNSADGEVVYGYISDFDDPNLTMTTTVGSPFNAITVELHRNEQRNGNLSLFFGPVLGVSGTGIKTKATAAFIRDVKGFQVPNDGSCIDILPYALDLDTWNAWMAGAADDDWTYNDDGTITPGADGELEVNLFPQGTGSPGNRGTVDIGGSNNSTNDIARQIVYGVSPEDLAYHGGTLEFGIDGTLTLNGDTGISAGVKDELASIKGQPRIIPIFSSVSGNGNNADYTIVKWFGIRIVDVKLTGPMNKKHVTIQAAACISKGLIPSTTPGTSSYVYSPVTLVK